MFLLAESTTSRNNQVNPLNHNTSYVLNKVLSELLHTLRLLRPLSRMPIGGVATHALERALCSSFFTRTAFDGWIIRVENQQKIT